MRDSIQDSTRYVVNNLHRGSVLPGNRSELRRDVYLESGADVRGGIWSNSLFVHGNPVNVTDSVYCLASATVEATGDDDGKPRITFGSCVASNESLLIEEKSPKVKFESDIYTGQLNLTNAFVYGNVFARRAVIRDSVILGGVFCEQSLTLERSFVSTFNADRVEIGEGTGMFMTYATANDQIVLRAPMRVLTFYSLYQDVEGEIGDAVVLDEADIFSVNIDDAEDGSSASQMRRIQCISILERVLDSEPLDDHIVFNKNFIEYLSLFRNFTPDAKSRFGAVSLENLEAALWDLLEEDVDESRQRAGRSIRDLHERFASSSAA